MKINSKNIRTREMQWKQYWKASFLVFCVKIALYQRKHMRLVLLGLTSSLSCCLNALHPMSVPVWSSSPLPLMQLCWSGTQGGDVWWLESLCCQPHFSSGLSASAWPIPAFCPFGQWTGRWASRSHYLGLQKNHFFKVYKSYAGLFLSFHFFDCPFSHSVTLLENLSCEGTLFKYEDTLKYSWKMEKKWNLFIWNVLKSLWKMCITQKLFMASKYFKIK